MFRLSAWKNCINVEPKEEKINRVWWIWLNKIHFKSIKFKQEAIQILMEKEYNTKKMNFFF